MECLYNQAVLKFLKLNTQTQQREAVVQGRSLSPYRLQYTCVFNSTDCIYKFTLCLYFLP
ncbi:MAG: hypothetical protein LBJ00_17595 [Planctomycetaceae bacterium]|nr:hypothetical protein [Planctomycetaceae bacterium]